MVWNNLSVEQRCTVLSINSRSRIIEEVVFERIVAVFPGKIANERMTIVSEMRYLYGLFFYPSRCA